jgi:hypothetical protein
MLPLIAALILAQASSLRSFGESYAGDPPPVPAPPTFAPGDLAAPVDSKRLESETAPAGHIDSQRWESGAAPSGPVDSQRLESNPPDPFPISPFYEAAVVGNGAWVVWWRDGVLNTLAACRAERAGGEARVGAVRRVRIPGRPK